MDVLWLALAFGLGLLCRHLGLPPLVGYLAAGFALNGLDRHGGEALEQIAHAGVLLLLFSVGLKLRFKSLAGPEVWAGGGLHLAISGVLLGLAFCAIPGLAESQAFLLAMTSRFSSTVLAA